MIPSRAPDLDATVHACMSRGIRRIQVLEWRDLDDAAAGGAEKHVHEVVRRWAEAGLAVDIRTVEVPGGPAVIERDGYRVERIGGHHTGVLRATAAGATRLRKGTDAVYESWIGIPFWTPLWFRGPQLAFLYHLHDDLWESHFPSPLAKVGSLLEARLAPLAYRKVSIATLSRSSAAELKERTLFKPEQITIVPPGIGDEFRPTAPRSPEPLAVAAGRLVQAKRFDAVIDAFSDVATAIPEARLVVVGEGPEREALEAQVASLGLESVVDLPGWVDDSTLVDIFSSAWLLVAASISEGWGMTITEAAACGTGAIASDIVGHGDALHYSSGHLVADDAQLAARMKEVLSDRQLTDAMGVEARAASGALDWDATAASLLELLVQDAERRGVNLRKLLGWLPTGTTQVGLGLIINGVATYVFLVIPARSGRLDPDAYAVFSALWFAVFLLAPSIFFPLEQEVTRNVAARKNLGEPTGAVRRAGGIVLLVAAVGVVALLLALSPLLRDRLFDNETLLVIVLILATLGHGAAHFVRGLLAGHGDYADYGRLFAADGLIRAALVVVLIAIGVESAAVYAVPVVVAVWLATGWAWRKLPPAQPGGEPVPATRVGRAVAVLAVAQLSVMILMNGIPLALGLLADDNESDLVGQISAALVLARVPLFLFQAVQASLLPELTKFVAIGQIVEFRRRLRSIFAAVAALGVVVVMGAAIVAGFAMRVMFGDEFEVSAREFAALAASSMLVMLGLVLGMGLIALSQHRAVAISWGAGAVAFVVTVWLADGFVARVLAAGLVGPSVALMALAGSLYLALRNTSNLQPYADV